MTSAGVVNLSSPLPGESKTPAFSAASLAQTGAASGATAATATATAGSSASASASRVHVVTDSQRAHAAWIGGSMFASLSTFQQIRITLDEWKQDDSCVQKKSVLW